MTDRGSGRAKKRLLFVTIGIVVVFGALLSAGLVSGGSAPVTVAQALKEPAGTRVQVSGKVGSVNMSAASGGTFQLLGTQGPPLTVTVDVAPLGTFGTGSEAIVTGAADGKGGVLASNIITKCPSKYSTESSATGAAHPASVTVSP